MKQRKWDSKTKLRAVLEGMKGKQKIQLFNLANGGHYILILKEMFEKVRIGCSRVRHFLSNL